MDCALDTAHKWQCDTQGPQSFLFVLLRVLLFNVGLCYVLVSFVNSVSGVYIKFCLWISSCSNDK